MKKIYILFLSIFLFLTTFSNAFVVQAKNTEDEAKNAIVEIQTGIMRDYDKFDCITHGEGVVVSKGQSGTYILTTDSLAKVTDKQKEKYRKDHNLDANMSLQTVVKVINYRNDKKDAQIVVSETAYNYAILQVSGDFGGKETQALALGDSANLKSGDSCKTLGFDVQDLVEKGRTYNSGNVTQQSGSIKDSSVSFEGLEYLETSISITDGYNGAPLLDANNYVIGINDSKVTIGDKKSVYVIPIDDVKESLDRNSIRYRTEEYDDTYDKIQELVKTCNELDTSSYKKASVNQLNEQVQVAASVVSMPLSEVVQNYELKDLKTIYTNLQNSYDGLNAKMSMLLVIGFILLACSGVLLFMVISSFNDVRTIRASLMGIQEEMNRINLRINSRPKEPKPVVEVPRQVETPRPISVAPERPKPVHKEYVTISKLHHDKSGSSVELTRTITMGKLDGENDFVIRGNKYVSGRHCRIERQNDDFVIYDLNSSNGTYINGNRLSGQGYVLQHGDEIRLASEAFHYTKQVVER